MVFGRKGKEKSEIWKWEGKVMEEVKEFKYLGFTFERNGGYGKHLKELKIKGAVAAKKYGDCVRGFVAETGKEGKGFLIIW